MSRNIEIKARVLYIDALASKVAALADQGPIEIQQDDTFFACERGRLKLRVFADGTGELIFYQRANQSGPKESFYVRSPTSDPDSLRNTLELAYGIVGRVRKHRTLYLIGQTRVHFDRVAGLGEFLELEVVLMDSESEDQGVAITNSIMSELGIETHQLVEHAYVDLMGG